MTVDLKIIAEFIGVILTIGGVLYAVFKWVNVQNNQTAEIERVKGENELVCRALLACLDGLEQLGANHSVSSTKQELNDYINKLAHK